MEMTSVFDVMELDDTEHRVASRRTLALAHNRIERNLGSMLRGAVSEEDFEERLALVQDDFAGYISVAADETGHEHPEHIAAALKDHYRLVAQANAENAAKIRWSTIRPISGDKQSAPLAEPQSPWGAVQDQYAGTMPWERPGDGVMMGGPETQQGMGTQYPQAPMDEAPSFQGPEVQGQQGAIMSPNLTVPPQDFSQYGPHQGGVNALVPQGRPQQGWGQENDVDPHVCPMCGGDSRWCPHGQQAQMGMGAQQSVAPPGWTAAKKDPSLQTDTSDETVTCPQCGGNGKTANGSRCHKCRGKGKVPNFGDSLLDSLDKTSENQNNLNMTEPEEPINRSQGPGKMPEVPGDIKRKDILVPMRATNEGELDEIGDIEHVDLPGTDDMDSSGFSTEQKPSVEKGNWPKVPQADPVTRTTQSSEGNPLITLIQNDWPSPEAVEMAFQRI